MNQTVQKSTRVQNLGSFVWSIADILRGDFKQSDYGKVILPFIVMRRLDCILEAAKPAVLAAEKGLPEGIDDETLHYMHGDHVDEHVIAVSATNPTHCTPEIRCSGHEHGPNCKHEVVPHGDHIDYLVKGRLHHPHGDHCDDHGPVQLA